MGNQTGTLLCLSLSKRKWEKQKEREKLLSLPHTNTSSSSDSDLNPSSHSDATCLVLDGTPGIPFGRMWTPIAARTRYNLKVF